MATFGKMTQATGMAGPRPAFGKRPAGAPLPPLPALKPAAKPVPERKPAPEMKAPRPAETHRFAPPAETAPKPPAPPKPVKTKPKSPSGAGDQKPVWGRRVAARLVDELGLWCLIFLVFHDSMMASLNAYASVEPGSAAEAAATVELLGYALIFVVGQSVYNIAMESSSYQATLGKMLVGAQVTDRFGGSPRLRAVILRNTVGRLAANVMPLGSGYLLGLFNAERRCVHDMVAGTVVRRRAPGGATSSYGEVFA
ncbi:MAG: RDD family protein [Hyphomonas sp.]|uniref:RDD family protein n=1 Tax=Hyphomonas sp. TaxID=87 RepID=UPI0017AA4FAD|nr:RDD family protein [Hyphomonas sp.]MBA3068847.1 RDD family protein [Hyphomonas sp.]MBU4062942.1 RDD family protein [Alphaproteobacteria bacterium]MBU4165474.1 RDD family protein [Alphaproteobacteria bacterium]